MKTNQIVNIVLYFSLAVLIFSAVYFAYMFYTADCQTVKKWWLFVQVPGRCL